MRLLDFFKRDKKKTPVFHGIGEGPEGYVCVKLFSGEKPANIIEAAERYESNDGLIAYATSDDYIGVGGVLGESVDDYRITKATPAFCVVSSRTSIAVLSAGSAYNCEMKICNPVFTKGAPFSVDSCVVGFIR